MAKTPKTPNSRCEGKLHYLYSTMGAGKSTYALQLNHNYMLGNRKGIMITMSDRSGCEMVTSRMGISFPAFLMEPSDDLFMFIEEFVAHQGIQYVICDEVQFYAPEQIEHLAYIVDIYGVDIFCFGIATDFRTELFPAAKRLLEIADVKKEIELIALCWCGKKAIFNARVINGQIIHEGEQVQLGDVGTNDGYEPLCREHLWSGVSRKQAEEWGML